MKKEKTLKNQRRMPVQVRARAKYDAVLDSCTQVLLEKGYSKTSIFELSLTSGVAVPTIYQYFDGKEDIFQRWFSRLASEVFEDLLHKSFEQKHNNIVESYLYEALSVILQQRSVVKLLLDEFPQALSTQLVSDIEEQTQAFVSRLLLFDDQQLENPNLQLLTQVLLGYMLQVAFYSNREVDIAFEAKELGKITNFYLQSLVDGVHDN